MDFNSFIDGIAQKYSYDEELTSALKKIVPIMAETKSSEAVQIILDTLERVQIYTFDTIPNQEQLDTIEAQKVNGRNDGVNFVYGSNGEYGKTIAPGAYSSTPVFDKDMNLVDRVGYLYTTKLMKNSPTAKFYGTRINMSHLIHELGHAVASQVNEYVQSEDGIFSYNVGAFSHENIVDRENKTVHSSKKHGLFIEEALNSIEEERILCELYGIENFKEIPGYIKSKYQGLMTDLMRQYESVIGSEQFSDFRILKDKDMLMRFEECFEQTQAYNQIGTPEYVERKKGIFQEVYNINRLKDEKKAELMGFFEKYNDLFWPTKKPENYLEMLDGVLEQFFDFQTIKYSFNLIDVNRKNDEKNLDIYKKILSAIYVEGLFPLSQARETIRAKKPILMKNLTRQACADLEFGKSQNESNHYNSETTLGRNDDSRRDNDEQER